LKKRHFVNQIVHDVPCRHEETIQELWILESWFVSNYFFSTANICPLWMARKNPRLDASSIETQSMFESSSHSVLTEYGIKRRLNDRGFRFVSMKFFSFITYCP